MSVTEKYNLPLPVGRSSALASKAVEERMRVRLKKYNVTLEDIQSGRWRYCGGETGHRQKYFHLCQPGREHPEHEVECACGHEIEENCYITNGETIIVLGNVCINRFLPENLAGRSCSDCGRRHKNRKVDLCNSCR